MDSINSIEKTFRQLQTEGHEILRLFSGNPNEQGIRFPPEILQEIYQDYFRYQEYSPHPKGLLIAREAIAAYYAEQGVSVDPENIILTSGTSESFFYLFSLLAKPGENFLTPNPSYPLFDWIAHLTHVELRHYHLQEENHWSVDLESIKRAANPKTKGLILISPHNPTGSVISSHQLGDLIEWANERGLPIITDEVFSEFYFGEGKFPRLISAGKPHLAFTLNGISKMFALPALKLGWIVVTGERRLAAEKVDWLETTADTFLSSHIPIQKGLPQLFKQGNDFLRIYRQMVSDRREAAVQMLRSIESVRFVPPQGGFYLMAEVKKGIGLSEEEFVIRLMKEEGIFVHPGYFYDYDHGIHFVISCLTEEERLQTGLEKVGRFLGNH